MYACTSLHNLLYARWTTCGTCVTDSLHVSLAFLRGSPIRIRDAKPHKASLLARYLLAHRFCSSLILGKKRSHKMFQRLDQQSILRPICFGVLRSTRLLVVFCLCLHFCSQVVGRAIIRLKYSKNKNLQSMISICEPCKTTMMKTNNQHPTPSYQQPATNNQQQRSNNQQPTTNINNNNNN